MPPTPWSDIQNIFAPRSPVPADRLDKWFETRPDSPLPALLKRLAPTQVPVRHILVGQPASGKSSEVAKLAAELSKIPDTFVVRIDMMDHLDPNEANPVDILFLMGAAVFKAAKHGLPDEQQPNQSLLDRLKECLDTVVRTSTNSTGFKMDLTKVLGGLIVYGGAAIAGAVTGGPIGAAAALTAVHGVQAIGVKLNPFRFSSGFDTKEVHKREVEPNVLEMIEALNALLEEVSNRSHRKLILLIDGLDKIRSTELIKVNFLERNYLNGPRCMVLYVGPLDLLYNADLGSVRGAFTLIPFSNVKLYGPNTPTTPHTPGYDFLSKVVRRRLESLNLKPDEVIPDDLLKLLIQGSGGVLRDLIRLVQNAALQADIDTRTRIERPQVLSALNALRREYRALLTAAHDKIVADVRKTKQRTSDPLCDVLLRDDVVLSYLNDDEWYDIHSILTPEPWK